MRPSLPGGIGILCLLGALGLQHRGAVAAAPVEVPTRFARDLVVAGKLDLNAASAKELEALPGIGPALSGRIVSDRDSRGPFLSVSSLERVKGIGPARRRALEPLVYVAGFEPQPTSDR
ncbi:MAG: helix-hairpin-helix domain-containing protein [Myxococcota bacterium]|nr:helix-hairpin-helix domain-containing protein [Myxococcota bacterium]